MPSRCNLVSLSSYNASCVLYIPNCSVNRPFTVFNRIVFSCSDPEALNDFLHGSETHVSISAKVKEDAYFGLLFILTKMGL